MELVILSLLICCYYEVNECGNNTTYLVVLRESNYQDFTESGCTVKSMNLQEFWYLRISDRVNKNI